MARRRSKKQDNESRFIGLSQARFINLSVAAGTFLTLGLSPLVHIPTAKADGEDVIIEQIINSLSAVDPTAALDMSSWLSSLDAALQGAANFDPSSLAGAVPDLGAVPDVGAVPDLGSALSAASTADPAALPAADPPSSSLAGLYDQYIYEPAHTWDQQWIAGTTFLGPSTVAYDNFINSLIPAPY